VYESSLSMILTHVTCKFIKFLNVHRKQARQPLLEKIKKKSRMSEENIICIKMKMKV
jgi:competence protein ComGF